MPTPMDAAAPAAPGPAEVALLPAVEGAATALLAVVLLLLAGFLAFILTLARRARRGESPEHTLIREVTRRPDPAHHEDESHRPPPAPAWEQDADWWKK